MALIFICFNDLFFRLPPPYLPTFDVVSRSDRFVSPVLEKHVPIFEFHDPSQKNRSRWLVVIKLVVILLDDLLVVIELKVVMEL